MPRCLHTLGLFIGGCSLSKIDLTQFFDMLNIHTYQKSPTAIHKEYEAGERLTTEHEHNPFSTPKHAQGQPFSLTAVELMLL